MADVSDDERPDAVDPWVTHAQWRLGKLSDEQYADSLVARGEPDDSPLILILRRHAREST